MSKSNFVPALLLCVMALTTGCASGGRNLSPEEEATAGTVELQVWNRSDRTLIAFARWGNSPRVRLGQLSGGRRGTYNTGVRGPNVAISWDIVSGSPPPATAGAGAAFPQVADGTGSPQCSISVQAGDRIEWTIQSNGVSCSTVRMDPS